MIDAVKQENARHPLVARYLARIPAELHPLLAPEPGQETGFAAALKALRNKEEERSYVVAIQQRYRLPLRPNETVKRTMIRVRLDILRRRREAEAEGEVIDNDSVLPVDPLE